MIQLSRRSPALVGLPLLAVTLLLLTSSSWLPASTPALPPGSLAPSARERMIARQVGSTLEESHFSRTKIDDRMSSRIMDKFLDALDGQRSYLLATDIAEFEPQRMRFDDMIRTGDIEPAYAMFARFQQRNRERIRYAIGLLEREPDFSLDERFEFDREHTPWSKSTAELDDLWRKRVKNDAIALMLAGKTWAETRDMLRTRYERVLKRVDQIKPEEVFETVMNAYARTFDPHSSYFSPRNSEEYKIQMSLNYEGIGASLQLVDEYVTIMNLIEGGPAAVAGTLSVKDRITAVGQGTSGPMTDVVGWRIDDVVQLIRGKGNTVVRLQILPVGAVPGSPEKTLQFTRGKVTLEAQAARKTLKTLKRDGREFKVAVINVPGFYSDYDAARAGDENYRSTTNDVRRLLEEARKEKIDGLVLDLRANGGGFLPEAQSLTGLFIDKGPVVQVAFANGEKEVLDDTVKGTAYDGPLVVLVDRFSASASEIFAGAIQDYHRGVIVGQRTFGKGTVQNLLPMSRWSSRPVNGQLTVTIGKFYRVTGESTQHRGVEPDVALASPISLKDVGESALDDALPWDRIQSAAFSADRSHDVDLTSLVAAENRRQTTDADYRWLVQDIDAITKLRNQKSLSLNLEQRRKERATLEADRLARENARRSAHGLAPLKASNEKSDDDAAEDAPAPAADKTAADRKSPDALPDVQLDQAVEVVGDLLTGAAGTSGAKSGKSAK